MKSPQLVTGEEATVDDSRDQTSAMQDEQAEETKEKNGRKSRRLAIRAERAEIANKREEVDALNDHMAQALSALGTMNLTLTNEVENSRAQFLAITREMNEVRSQRPPTTEEKDGWAARFRAEDRVMKGLTPHIGKLAKSSKEVRDQGVVISKEMEKLKLRLSVMPKKEKKDRKSQTPLNSQGTEDADPIEKRSDEQIKSPDDASGA